MAFRDRRNTHSAPMHAADIAPEQSPPREMPVQGGHDDIISSAASRADLPQSSELKDFPHILSQLVEAIHSQTQAIAGLQTQFQEVLAKVVADQQGISSSDRASLIRGFRRMRPSMFKGECDAEIAGRWIEEMEEIFGFIHCPDEYKVVLVVFALEERAELWGDYVVQVNFEGKEVIPWKDFLVVFREQFILRQPFCKLEQEFWRLVQGFTSVADYLDRFTELEVYVPFVRDCGWRRALMFLSGLREN